MTSNSRVWLITGSSRGIGRCLLEEVLSIGERAVATLRKPAVLDDLVAKYPASQLLVVPLDVAIEAQIVAAFEATKKHFGRLDVVVNNAGYGVQSEIEGMPEEAARKQFEVLFWGPTHVTREAIKFFRDINPPGHGGRILNISSCGGYNANPTLAYYSAAKFALEGFTDSFKKEMPPAWNIKGVIIQFGGQRTEWGGSSLVRFPPPAPYNAPDTPSMIIRKMADSNPYFGDPAKSAKALVRVADLADPPLRIQIGWESPLLVRQQAHQTIKDSEQYDELANSVLLDGMDVNVLVRALQG